ncbi:hypothetical protein EV182_007280, partial [Spiromyces aspiralis]
MDYTEGYGHHQLCSPTTTGYGNGVRKRKPVDSTIQHRPKRQATLASVSSQLQSLYLVPSKAGGRRQLEADMKETYPTDIMEPDELPSHYNDNPAPRKDSGNED